MMKQAEKGFTLIEAMVTMLIVSIGLLAMASLLITAIKVNQNNELRMNAAASAQAILGSVVLKARATPPTLTVLPYTQANAIADAQALLGPQYSATGIGGYNPVVTFSADANAGLYTNIMLTLEWSDRGTMKNVKVRAGVYTQ